jgi:hypothetical protein
MTGEQQKAMLAAADFFNDAARKLLTIDGRLHAETLIASVARMAGSLLFRSFSIDQKIEPGTAVFTEQANTQGPKLMQVMFATLQQLGHKVAEGNLNREFLNTKSSLLTFQQAHEKLAPFFLKYCETAPLGFEQAAVAAAITTGMLVHDCRGVLDIGKGGAIAVFGFVEGAKTAPFPVSAGPGEKSPTKQ